MTVVSMSSVLSSVFKLDSSSQLMTVEDTSTSVSTLVVGLERCVEQLAGMKSSVEDVDEVERLGHCETLVTVAVRLLRATTSMITDTQ